jgi:photosystem II stability/assembly factor-like uncharacterized protein
MRTSAAVLVAAVALIVLSGASASPSPSPLYPSAVAFSDRLHGELGLASAECDTCRPRGAVAVTSDGGKTWSVVRHTDRRVVALAFFHDVYYTELENGRLISGQSGSHNVFKGYCPKGWTSGYSADIVDTNIDTPWSICVGQPGAGNQAKAVYRGRKRVAYTPPSANGGYGGISSYGYPVGIAGTHEGFGIIWETRGTLYVTRDGGHHWHPLPKVAQPEVDFGDWADVVWGRLGVVLLMRSAGNSETSRLIETTDAGRTWHVVHRWHGRL